MPVRDALRGISITDYTRFNCNFQNDYRIMTILCVCIVPPVSVILTR
jgi:hypothetical protein